MEITPSAREEARQAGEESARREAAKARLERVAQEKMVSQARRQLDALAARARAGEGRTKAQQKEIPFLAGVAMPTHQGFSRLDRRRHLKSLGLLPSQARPVVEFSPPRERRGE